MKLIVQIPCHNEAETLPQTVADIPRTIPGVNKVEILVIDDGSSDETVAVARRFGVNHVVTHKCNRGLARTFRTGLDACLGLGADIIVSTDGDNQYAGADIPKLIQPILDGKADIVVGDRRTKERPRFSRGKKLLQALGSYVVRQLSETNIPDAVSGFRAFSREAALQITIVSPFSYTIETIIQSGKKHLAITSVPIRTNPKTRPSRLFKSVSQFIRNSAVTVVRIYAMYQPLRVFFGISAVFCLAGVVPIVRFLYFFRVGRGQGHVQSLVLGGVLLVLGFLAMTIGLLADLVSFNRQLIEMTLEKVLLQLRELCWEGEKTKEPGVVPTRITRTRMDNTNGRCSGTRSNRPRQPLRTPTREPPSQRHALSLAPAAPVSAPSPTTCVRDACWTWDAAPANCPALVDASRYLGVDIDPALLALAKRRFPNHRFLVLSELSETEKFEVIVALAVIEHIDDPAKLAARVAGLPRPRRQNRIDYAGARLSLVA